MNNEIRSHIGEMYDENDRQRGRMKEMIDDQQKLIEEILGRQYGRIKKMFYGQHELTKMMLDRLVRLEAQEEVDQASNWNACMESTFKQLMKNDERIGEALIGYLGEIPKEIERISKQRHQGRDFLKLLGHMMRVVDICEDLGLIEYRRTRYKHVRQYFVDDIGDLSNGI